MQRKYFETNYQVGDEDPLPGLEGVAGPLTQVKQLIINYSQLLLLAYKVLLNQEVEVDISYTEVR